MTEATDRLLEKLAKLKRHADSAQAIGSTAEAEAFASAFQRMLIEHKLEMSDVELADLSREEPIQKHFIKYEDYEDIKLRRRRIEWTERLGDIVARAHFCRVLVHPGSSRITFVGRRSDAKIAEYMFVTLHRAAERLADAEYARFSVECVKRCQLCSCNQADHKKSFGHHSIAAERYGREHAFVPDWARCRGFRPSFLVTFIARLDQRYAEQRARMNSAALVRCDKEVEAFVNAKDDDGKPKIKNAEQISTHVRFNREGVKRGKEAADAVNLAANAVETEQRKALK